MPLLALLNELLLSIAKYFTHSDDLYPLILTCRCFPHAVAFDLEDMVKVLLELGADPNILDKSPDTSETALHPAALHQYPEIIKLLLQKGENVNVRNAHGDMPLHLVFSRSYVAEIMPESFEVIKLLLEGGADVTAENERDMTFLDLAV